MNILHINRNYIFNNLHQIMINNLNSSEKLENKVFVPICRQQKKKYKADKNVIVTNCFNSWDKFFFDYKQYKIFKQINRIYTIKDFDCIHAYTLFTDGNCAKKLSDKYNIPYVVAVRNTDVNDFFEKIPFLRKRGIEIMKKSSAIFFLSHSYYKTVFDKYVPKDIACELKKKAHIIPNGIDSFWLNHISNNSTEKINRINNLKELKIIYVGRIDKNKNILTTIKGLEMISDEFNKIVFTIIGKIENEAEYNKISKCKFVNYIPQLTKEELLTQYRIHDLFIMPSFTETFGLTYVEAMSQGLPVIYTINQGFDGQFPEGVVGYHVDPYNPFSISVSIKKILKNYKEISKRACDNCLQYDWKELSKRYENIYSSIMIWSE